MCTVTFIPGKDHIVITANRDEKLSRKKAIAPMVYRGDEYKMIFPKDAAAGGSWIGLKENGDAAVLLNGGFLPHVPRSTYLKSRGLVFLDILAATPSLVNLMKLDLQDTEPFTLVLFQDKCLYEFRWDGIEKYCKELAADRFYIWSSITLYDTQVKKKREHWFNSFMNRNVNPTQQDILQFHRFAGDGDSSNDLLMRRDGIYSTVSITSMFLSKERGSMKYVDLSNERITEKKIEFVRSIPSV